MSAKIQSVIFIVLVGIFLYLAGLMFFDLKKSSFPKITATEKTIIRPLAKVMVVA